MSPTLANPGQFNGAKPLTYTKQEKDKIERAQTPAT